MRRLAVPVLLAGVAGITLLVALRVDRGPFQRGPMASESVVWAEARAVASGTGEPPASRRSLFAVALSPLATDSLTAVQDARRILTLIFLPLISILVWALARKRAGPWPSVLAGLAAAASGPLVLAAGSLAPAAAATAAGLFALFLLDHRRNWVSWILAGAATGLAYRLHPLLGTGLGILLLAAAWWAPGRGRRLPAAFGLTGAWLAVVLAAGVALHAAPVPGPLNGIGFFRGHRALASGVAPRRGDTDAQRWWTGLDFLREASRAEERGLPWSETQWFWAGRGVKQALTSPLAGLRRNGVKLLATYQGDPLAGDVSPAFLRKEADGQGLGVVTWLGRILIPLGLAGLVLARRRVGILWAGVLSGLVASWLTYADPQTRLLGVACAAVGLALLVDVWWRGGTGRRLAATGIAVLFVAIFGVGPTLGLVPGNAIQSDDAYYLGAFYDSEKRGSVAMREYERALRANPDNPYPRLAIARMLARDHVYEESGRELERLREDHPDFVPGLQALADVYQYQEKWSDAGSVFAELIRLEPWNPEPWNNLGTMYVQIGFYDQAAKAFESALQLAPNYQVAQDNLEGLRVHGLAAGLPAQADSLRRAQEDAVARIRAGETAAADSTLQAAYARFGRLPDLVFVEGTLRLVDGEPGRAVTLFESIRDKMQGSVIFLNNLGTAYTQVGRLQDARKTLQEALKIQPANRRLQINLDRVQAAIDSVSAVGSK